MVEFCFTNVQTVVPRHFLLRDHCLLYGHGERIVRIGRDYRGRPDQRSGGAEVRRVRVADLGARAGYSGQIRCRRRLRKDQNKKKKNKNVNQNHSHARRCRRTTAILMTTSWRARVPTPIANRARKGVGRKPVSVYKHYLYTLLDRCF